jgi:hypothetical protein
VKQSNRIYGVVVLTAIYCLTIVAFTYLPSFDSKIIPKTSQQKHFTDFSSKLFVHTSQSKSSKYNCNNIPYPIIKKIFSGQLGISKATDKLIETAFSQYHNISRNFLIQHRKSDIIYPFHYFW